MSLLEAVRRRFQAKDQGEAPHGFRGPHCSICLDKGEHPKSCKAPPVGQGCSAYSPLEHYIRRNGEALLDSDYYVCKRHYQEQWKNRYPKLRCPV